MQSDEAFVCRLISGQLVLEQAGREVVMEAGDMALLDPLLPYEGKFSAGVKLLVLKAPRRSMEARVGKITDMVTRTMKPAEAEHGLASAFLAMLPDYAGRLGAAAKETVKNQTLDLVAISLAKTQEGPRPYLSSAKASALINVRAAVEAHLADPRLDAEMVAAAAGVSVRYANALLFAQEGTSIARLVQSRRLDRCHKALKDPLFRLIEP